MKLSDLCAGICGFPAALAHTEIIRITDDSREAARGVIFFASSAGSAFVDDARGRGALIAGPGHLSPDLRAEDPAQIMGLLSARLNGDPGRSMQVVGITGTNGKTSTAWMVYHLWLRSGIRAGLIGTLGVRYSAGSGEKDLATGYTTPRSYQTQKILAEMRAEGVTHCVMEVSSEALALGRLAGVPFSCAGFTNFTRDHLDFHKTMENYFAAKQLLFAQTAECGGRLVSYLPEGEDLEGYSRRMADYARSLSASAEIIHRPVDAGFAASFQNANAAVALACAFEETAVRTGHLQDFKSIPQVPGRFETIDLGRAAKDSVAVVDYAHSPDAVETLLSQASRSGRYVITVLGCGGNRDPGKRPVMGEISARLSGTFILTDDNPRKEDPEKIRRDVLAGIPEDLRQKVREIGDRRTAIREAVREAARRGSCIVVVAGKGHERVQILHDRTEPFSDQEEVRAAIDEVAAGAQG